MLDRKVWSSPKASGRLLAAMVETFAPSCTLLMALDDTIERRRGAKIAARGLYRAPA